MDRFSMIAMVVCCHFWSWMNGSSIAIPIGAVTFGGFGCSVAGCRTNSLPLGDLQDAHYRNIRDSGWQWEWYPGQPRKTTAMSLALGPGTWASP